MRITGKAQHKAWVDRVPPEVEQVRSGVWSVPVPIPDNPLRYTLCYAIDAGSGLLLVDPGWDSPDGWEALNLGLSAASASITDVVGVVLTHVHADHHGLTARVRETSGAWVAMHEREIETLPARRFATPRAFRDDRDGLIRCGVPADGIDLMVLQREMMAQFMTMPEPDVALGDFELLPTRRTIRTIWTPGHTPGHICLLDELDSLLFTGDHVLPRITPNIGVDSIASEPQLAEYLGSLEKVAAFDVNEVLPAHEYRFRGVADRVQMLLRHHRRRCYEIESVLMDRGPSTVWEVSQALRWSRTWSEVVGLMRRAAVAETYAHLAYLRDAGRVSQRMTTDEFAPWLFAIVVSDSAEPVYPNLSLDPAPGLSPEAMRTSRAS